MRSPNMRTYHRDYIRTGRLFKDREKMQLEYLAANSQRWAQAVERGEVTAAEAMATMNRDMAVRANIDRLVDTVKAQDLTADELSELIENLQKVRNDQGKGATTDGTDNND